MSILRPTDQAYLHFVSDQLSGPGYGTGNLRLGWYLIDEGRATYLGLRVPERFVTVRLSNLPDAHYSAK